MLIDLWYAESEFNLIHCYVCLKVLLILLSFVRFAWIPPCQSLLWCFGEGSIVLGPFTRWNSTPSPHQLFISDPSYDLAYSVCTTISAWDSTWIASNSTIHSIPKAMFKNEIYKFIPEKGGVVNESFRRNPSFCNSASDPLFCNKFRL